MCVFFFTRFSSLSLLFEGILDFKLGFMNEWSIVNLIFN